MQLHTLTPAKGSVKNGKRIGRGQGSGKGGTSARGHKGAKSRSGYSKKIGFEGGQMPLQRRVPKFGFKNNDRIEYKPINLDTISSLVEKFNVDSIDFDFLKEHGYAQKNDKVKVLGRGELAVKVDLNVHKISESARKAIEDKGGNVTLL